MVWAVMGIAAYSFLGWLLPTGPSSGWETTPLFAVFNDQHKLVTCVDYSPAGGNSGIGFVGCYPANRHDVAQPLFAPHPQ